MSVRVVRKTDRGFFFSYQNYLNSLELYQNTMGCTRGNAELILASSMFPHVSCPLIVTRGNAELILASSMFPHVSCPLIVTPTPRLLLLLCQRSAPKYRDAVRAQTWGYLQFMTETRQTPKYWPVLLPLFLGPHTCHQSLKWSTHVVALWCDSKNMYAVWT